MTDSSRADLLLSFLRRRGLDSLSLIVEHLNRGTTHKRIAVMLNMDAGQFSRFVHATMKRSWIVAPEIADIIELYQQYERRQAVHVTGMGERTHRIA